ncbi:MAG: DNA polymerase III subunit delta' [Dehalococcoidia bacterium]|nr:DNA polymerase III subunit delta' [Dehalococcoidia bacterium]
MWRVIGHNRILALLDRSIREHSIAHAYLLVGPPHVGKTTLALDLAQALNCNDADPPCGQCRSCRRIIEDKHADVVMLTLDPRAQINIDDTGELRQKAKISTGSVKQLQHLANLTPYEGKYKVFIIENAEYMSPEASNRTLKILEEPPPNVVWLLLSTQETKLLPTVASRCQRLELKPLPQEQMQAILTDSYSVGADEAALLARLSGGCPGWALSAVADDGLLRQRRQIIDRLRSLLIADLGERFDYARELATQFTQDRRAVSETITLWLRWWRDLMLIRGGWTEALVNVDCQAELEEQAQSLSLSTIKDFITSLRQTEEFISKNVNPRLAFESLMLGLPKIEVNLSSSHGTRPAQQRRRSSG